MARRAAHNVAEAQHFMQLAVKGPTGINATMRKKNMSFADAHQHVLRGRIAARDMAAKKAAQGGPESKSHAQRVHTWNHVIDNFKGMNSPEAVSGFMGSHNAATAHRTPGFRAVSAFGRASLKGKPTRSRALPPERRAKRDASVIGTGSQAISVVRQGRGARKGASVGTRPALERKMVRQKVDEQRKKAVHKSRMTGPKPTTASHVHGKPHGPAKKGTTEHSKGHKSGGQTAAQKEKAARMGFYYRKINGRRTKVRYSKPKTTKRGSR